MGTEVLGKRVRQAKRRNEKVVKAGRAKAMRMVTRGRLQINHHQEQLKYSGATGRSYHVARISALNHKTKQMKKGLHAQSRVTKCKIRSARAESKYKTARGSVSKKCAQ